MDLKDIRKEYARGGLKKCDAPSDPLALFDRWMREALEAGLTEPTAMVLATVSSEGEPSGRTVLLKEVRQGEFIFFTHYESRKGRQMQANPHVSLTFPWYGMERQVHVEGLVHKLPPEESDAYFRTRPRNSRIGAVISPQSRAIPGRMDLIRRFIRKQHEIGDGEVERPPQWGGYAVTPHRIEFWQGRENRLHDRLLYTREADGRWKIVRLAP